MSDFDRVLQSHREAVMEIASRGEAAASNWTTPRKPGKWSPSQVVEHIALTLEQSALAVSGKPAEFPSMPGIVRPLLRSLFFKRILKSGKFPKAKTSKYFDPDAGPETPEAGRARLDGALSGFEAAVQACHEGPAVVETSVFGRVPVADYLRFNELHTRHHTKQISIQA